MNQELAARFSRFLSSSGYRMFHSAFGDGNQQYDQWRQNATKLEEPLRSLVELFLIGRGFPIDHVRRIIGNEFYDALLAENVLIESTGQVCTPGLILVSFRSLLFFHENTRRPGIYFGADSVALGIYQHPAHAGRTLDLCAGTGIQAMISAQHGSESVAVEIHPRAARLASLNLRLNNLENKVRIVNQSLEDFAASHPGKFHLITFNPPLLPVPDAIDYPFVGDGGGDALDVTRRVLALYIPLLTEDGAMEFIGCGMGRDHKPLFVDELTGLARKHGAGGIIQLLKRYDMKRGDSFYEALIATAAMNSRLSCDLADAVYEEHFRRLGYDELYTFFMRIEKLGSEAVDPRTVRITNISDAGQCWFHATVGV